MKTYIILLIICGIGGILMSLMNIPWYVACLYGAGVMSVWQIDDHRKRIERLERIDELRGGLR
jgi:hypothetical protein